MTNKNGSKWIRKEKRMAIYLRDGLFCFICNRDIEQTILSLDHIKPRDKGGSHHHTNLITMCCDCNRERYDRPFQDFVKEKLPETWEAALLWVKTQIRRPIDIEAGRAMLAIRKETEQNI